MRVSVRENDPGYKNINIALSCDIFVNGEAVTARCHTADDEKGKAYCFLWDEKGQVFLNGITKEPAEEVLVGKVEIKPRNPR